VRVAVRLLGRTRRGHDARSSRHEGEPTLVAQQNKSLKQDCTETPNCWLPRDHQGKCQPVYERGDSVKVEFPDETTGIGEWMWMIVDNCDDQKRVVFGTLDNEPVNDYGGKVKIGSQLAVNYDKVREHKKSGEFGPH
jgi:hypothetical protein